MTKNSLIFAPLEGITDNAYRLAILELFPQWDYLFTDFYRVPSGGRITPAAIMEHFGHNIYHNEQFRQKTVFQILAAPNSQIEDVASVLRELQINWVDFNAGCPARKVNAHHGGSWLLSEPKELQMLLKRLRAGFHGKLSVKIRSGYLDTKNFDEILCIIEGEGADLLTVHPRTKTQMYLGHSDWQFITRAVEKCSIPVIGNGDLVSVEAMNKMSAQTQCAGLMVGRAAVGEPGLAAAFKQVTSSVSLNTYYRQYLDQLRSSGRNDQAILKRFKAIAHYLPFPRETVSTLLHAQELNLFFDLIEKMG